MKPHTIYVTWDEDGFIWLRCPCGWKEKCDLMPRLDLLTESGAAHMLETERTVRLEGVS